MMRRAIALADQHLGQTGTNPSVGCVIACEGLVVGEGVTGLGGHPHAEELALAAAGHKAHGATVFVTLEPCAQRSKGGISCSERLCESGVVAVSVACADPSHFAAGKGAARLVQAGIDVRMGIMAQEAAYLYRDYRPAS